MTGATFHYYFEGKRRGGTATAMGATKKRAGRREKGGEYTVIITGVAKILLAEGCEKGAGLDRWTCPDQPKENGEIREDRVLR